MTAVKNTPPGMCHEPITREQKIAGLARLMARLRTPGERGAMARRLEQIHTRVTAQEVVDQAREILQEKRRGRA